MLARNASVSSLLVRNASVARKYRSCQVSTVQEQRIHDTSLHSNTKCDDYIRKELYEFSRYGSCGLNDTSLQSNTKCDVYIRKEILMLCPVTNQVLAQLGLLTFGGKPLLARTVSSAPLTVFAQEQADDYLVVKDESSFKGGHYRY